MNKMELIEEIAVRSELSKKDVAKCLDNFRDVITDEIKDGGKVKLVGFGSFSAKVRPERTYRNPQDPTKVVTKEECLVPVFKFGDAFKIVLNK